MKFINPLFGLIYLIVTCFAFTTVLEPRIDDCYSIEMEALDLFLISYDVIEGGDQFIDFKLYNPFGVLLQETLGRKDAYYSYNASNPGEHKYCFGNQVTQKKINFVPNLVKHSSLGKKEDDSHRYVQEEISKMEEYMNKIEGQIYFSLERDSYHTTVSEKTASKIKWWTIFQALSVVAICLWQVSYLKSFFENRRIV